jgi:hypothetical protein
VNCKKMRAYQRECCVGPMTLCTMYEKNVLSHDKIVMDSNVRLTRKIEMLLAELLAESQ